MLGPFGVTSDGQGGTKVVAIQTSFDVSSAADLNAALTAISQGGTSYAKNAACTIHFSSDISLASLAAGADLAAINLDTGSSLLIDGAGFTLDGANAHRGFFEYAGSIKIQHLTIAHMLAQEEMAASAAAAVAPASAAVCLLRLEHRRLSPTLLSNTTLRTAAMAAAPSALPRLPGTTAPGAAAVAVEWAPTAPRHPRLACLTLLILETASIGQRDLPAGLAVAWACPIFRIKAEPARPRTCLRPRHLVASAVAGAVAETTSSRREYAQLGALRADSVVAAAPVAGLGA
ncbi:hypothetical protein ACRAVF_24075 [Bradyrhizobium oligotrophicum S58]